MTYDKAVPRKPKYPPPPELFESTMWIKSLDGDDDWCLATLTVGTTTRAWRVSIPSSYNEVSISEKEFDDQLDPRESRIKT